MNLRDLIFSQSQASQPESSQSAAFPSESNFPIKPPAPIPFAAWNDAEEDEEEENILAVNNIINKKR